MKTQNILKVVVWIGLMSLTSASLAAEGVWTKKADMPTARIWFSTSVVNGKVYAIGGGPSATAPYLSNVEVYDPVADTWTRKADMPTARDGHAAGVFNGKIYVIGGEPTAQASLSTVEEYDPSTDTWKRKANMPTQRTFSCACTVGDKIYVLGGVTAGVPGAAFEPVALDAYDPTTDTWTTISDVPTPRAGAGVCAVDGKMYFIGGVQGGLHNAPTSIVEEYDPSTNTWTRKADMPTARMFLSANTVSGKIYAIGGSVWNGPILSVVEEYDPTTDSWTKRPDMPTARHMHAASAVSGKIYAIGGSRQWYPGTGISTVEECDLRPLLVGAPEILAQGSQLHSAFGLYFDGSDRLYIACGFGPEIAVMDPETGKILDRITTDVHGPDDLTIGPDGLLYWTDILTGEVGRRTPEGMVTKQFVAPGVNPITLSGDGRLFTALALLGDALYELDPDLKNSPRLIAENLGMLNGFDFGPDGFLYSPVPFQGKIVRIDVDTGEITPVVAEGVMAPSVKFDSKGRLYTQNRLNNEIVRVDTATGSMEVIATVPFGMDNLAFDSKDRLFCSESTSGAIFEVFDDGTTRVVHSGGLIIAGSVAVQSRADGGESVFAADGWTLREFDGATGEARGTYGVGCNPTSVSADGGNLVLSSWLLGNAVQVWNPQTQATVEDHADFARPVNAIRFQGDLIVADVGFETGVGRVVRVSAADPAQRTTLAEGLGVPLGLTATENDLWLSDWGAGTVLQLVADSNLLAPPTVVATGLARPEGLAVGPDGNLLVAETGAGRLSHIDLASGEVTALVEGLELGLPGSPAFPPAHICTGVAVGPSGAIYITSDVNNQLLVIHPVDPSLVAYWKLDETEGLIAYDSAGQNDASLIGGPVWQPDAGKIGGTLALDGVDDCAFAQQGLNPADGSFSIFAWVKGGAPGQVIVSQVNGANWLLLAPSGTLMTELKQSGRQGKVLTSSTVVTDGVWHRVGLVCDGSNRALYVDDVEVARDTQAGLEGLPTGLYVGTGKNMEAGTFWSGLIDDIRIYNRAVSP